MSAAARVLRALLLTGFLSIVVVAALIAQFATTPTAIGALSAHDWETPKSLDAIACPSVTFCVAVGSTTNDSSHSLAVVAMQHQRRWQVAAVVPKSIGGKGLSFHSVACASARNCIAVGQVFALGIVVAIAEVGGRWLRAHIILSPAHEVATGGYFTHATCSVGGICWAFASSFSTVTGHGPVSYAVGELNGRWLSVATLASNLKLSGSDGSLVSAASCWSRSSCTVIGGEVGNKGKNSVTFVQSETAGVWANATVVPNVKYAALNLPNFRNFSCVGAGSCEVGGFTEPPGRDFSGVVLQEVNGRWLTPATSIGRAPGDAMSEVTTITCPSATLCIATGPYGIKGHDLQLYVQVEKNLHWEPPVLLPVTIGYGYATSSVSCATNSECYVVGRTQGAGTDSQAYLVSYAHGFWSDAKIFVLGNDGSNTSGLYGLSCSAHGCWALGGIGKTATTAVSVTYFFRRSG